MNGPVAADAAFEQRSVPGYREIIDSSPSKRQPLAWNRWGRQATSVPVLTPSWRTGKPCAIDPCSGSLDHRSTRSAGFALIAPVGNTHYPGGWHDTTYTSSAAASSAWRPRCNWIRTTRARSWCSKPSRCSAPIRPVTTAASSTRVRTNLARSRPGCAPRAARRDVPRSANDHGILHERCGKIVVATSDGEIPGSTNSKSGVCERTPGPQARLSAGELREHEPHVAVSPDSLVPKLPASSTTQMSARVSTVSCFCAGAAASSSSTAVTGVTRSTDEIVVKHLASSAPAGVITRCGLQCDRVARFCRLGPGVQISGFAVSTTNSFLKHHLVKNLMPGSPGPTLPFLGDCASTPAGQGGSTGPNAVYAFERARATDETSSCATVSEMLRVSRLLQDGGRQVLAGGLMNSTASLSKPAIHVSGTAETDAGDSGSRPRPGGARVYALARPWTPKDRLLDDFSHRAGRTFHPRAQRAVASHHSVAQHRPLDRGTCGAPASASPETSRAGHMQSARRCADNMCSVTASRRVTGLNHAIRPIQYEFASSCSGIRPASGRHLAPRSHRLWLAVHRFSWRRSAFFGVLDARAPTVLVALVHVARDAHGRSPRGRAQMSRVVPRAGSVFA